MGDLWNALDWAHAPDNHITLPLRFAPTRLEPADGVLWPPAVVQVEIDADAPAAAIAETVADADALAGIDSWLTMAFGFDE